MDGKNDEWAGEAPFSDKASGVDYAFRNDADYLYILLVFKDSKSLSSIEATGMSIFGDPAGKDSRGHGLLFRSKAITAEELIAILEKKGQALTEERKNELRSRASYLVYGCQVVDKKGKIVTPGVEDLPLTPPAFRAGKAGESVVYEFRIPLAGGKEQPAGLEVAPGGRLTVGFQWGGLTKEMRDAIASESGFGGGGVENPSSQDLILEEAEGGGAGPGGPGFSSRMAQMRKRFRKHSFRVDVGLAEKKS